MVSSFLAIIHFNLHLLLTSIRLLSNCNRFVGLNGTFKKPLKYINSISKLQEFKSLKWKRWSFYLHEFSSYIFEYCSNNWFVSNMKNKFKITWSPSFKLLTNHIPAYPCKSKSNFTESDKSHINSMRLSFISSMKIWVDENFAGCYSFLSCTVVHWNKIF